MHKNQLNKSHETFSFLELYFRKHKNQLKGNELQKIYSLFIVKFIQVKGLSGASSHQEEGGK